MKQMQVWTLCLLMSFGLFSACQCGQGLPQEGQEEYREDAAPNEQESTKESFAEESSSEEISPELSIEKEVTFEQQEPLPETSIDTTPSKAKLSFRVLSKVEDIVPPRLKGIVLSPNPIQAGQVLSVEIETENDLSGVIAAQITLSSPNGKHSLYLSTLYHPSKKRFVSQQLLPSYVEGGEWLVRRVTLQDRAGNPTVYQQTQPPLDTIKLTVQSPKQDIEAPKLLSLTLLAQSAKAGGWLGLSLEVEDDPSGIKQIQVSATGDQGGYVEASAIYHPQRKRYEVYLPIPKTGPDGVWNLSQVQLEDLAENRRFVSGTDPLLTQKSFRVTDSIAPPAPSTDQTPPQIQGLLLSHTERTTEEQLHLYVKITDAESGVVRAQASITDPTGADRLSIDLSYNTSRELWEGQVLIPSFARDGIWKLKRLSASDRAGNTTTIEGVDLENQPELPQPSNPPKISAYATQGSAIASPDQLPPELLGMRIAPGEVQASEDARLYLALRDPGGSGIASASCTAQGPELGQSKRVLLQYNADTGFYEGNFRFQSEDALGTWWISGCYLTDRAGQAASIAGWQLQSLPPLDITRATTRAGQDPFTVLRKGTPPIPSTDQQAPTLKSYQISKSTLSVGHFLRMYAQVEDPEGEAKMLRCTFRSQHPPASYATTQLEITLTSHIATGRFEGEVEIPSQSIALGEWWLQECTASDRTGNTRRYEGKALLELPVLSIPELVTPPQEHRGFRVEPAPPVGDQIPPILEAVAIAPQQQVHGQPGRVFLKATDNDQIQFAFCSIKPPVQERPNTPYLAAQLSWNPQRALWEGNFTIPSHASAGDWTLSQCQATDRAGNQAKISDEEWSRRPPLDLSSFFPVSLKKQLSLQVTQGTPPPPKDITPPTLKGLRWLPAAQVEAGKAIVLELSAEDTESGIGQISALLQSPTQKASIWLSFKKNHGSLQWEAEVSIPRFQEDGAWVLSQVTLYDMAGNQASFGASDPFLQAAQLSVTKTMLPPDQDPPLLQSLQRSQATLLSGESVRFVAEIRDASPLSQSFLQVQAPSGKQQQVRLEWNPATSRYEGDLAFALYAEAGIWKISTLMASDLYGNNLRLDLTDPRLQALSITIRRPPQANDMQPPILGKVMLSSTQLKQGQAVRVLAEIIEMGSGVEEAQLKLEHTTSGQQVWGQLSLNPASLLYEATLSLPTTAALGEWKIASIGLSDRAGNSKNYTEKDPELQP